MLLTVATGLCPGKLFGQTSAPVITVQPASLTVAEGSSITVNVTVTGGPITGFSWLLGNGSINFVSAQVEGGTGSGGGAGSVVLSLPIDDIGTLYSGTYTVTVSNSFGSTTSNPATLTVAGSSYLSNFSARANVGVNNGVLIEGFTLAYPPGTVFLPGETIVPQMGSREVILRGVGPGLASTFGLSGTLAEPELNFYGSAYGLIATQAAWPQQPIRGANIPLLLDSVSASAMAAVGAFPLVPGLGDSAISAAPWGGSYTVVLSGANGFTGLALAEIYDAGNPQSGSLYPMHFSNFSARAIVGTGGNILIGGFYVAGSTAETLLIRAVGPGLATMFGLSGVLPNPQLAIFDSTGKQVSFSVQGGFSGSGWLLSSVSAQVGGFPLQQMSGDAAATVTLPPGAYTVQVSDLRGASGLALLEVYDVP